MTEEEKRAQWFAVQVLAGQENKVLENLTKRIKTEEMVDYVYEIIVPTPSCRNSSSSRLPSARMTTQSVKVPPTSTPIR